MGEVGDGFKIAMSALDSGRYSVAAGCVGICQGSLDASVAYAKEREQFGRPIGSFQLVQAMIADMRVQTDAARMLVYRAGFLKDQGRPSTTETSIAKLYATEAAQYCAHLGDPGPRRVGLRRRPPRRALLPRRAGDDALRGHLADPEADHRARRDRAQRARAVVVRLRSRTRWRRSATRRTRWRQRRASELGHSCSHAVTTSSRPTFVERPSESSPTRSRPGGQRDSPTRPATRAAIWPANDDRVPGLLWTIPSRRRSPNFVMPTAATSPPLVHGVCVVEPLIHPDAALEHCVDGELRGHDRWSRTSTGRRLVLQPSGLGWLQDRTRTGPPPRAARARPIVRGRSRELERAREPSPPRNTARSTLRSLFLGLGPRSLKAYRRPDVPQRCAASASDISSGSWAPGRWAPASRSSPRRRARARSSTTPTPRRSSAGWPASPSGSSTRSRRGGWRTGAAGRSRAAAELAALADADIVIEAAPESLELKRSLSRSSRRSCARTACSRPTPRRCASPRSPRGVPRPERVVGMHFFNPAPVMELVEVVAGEQSGEAALETTRALGARDGPPRDRRRRRPRLPRQPLRAALRARGAAAGAGGARDATSRSTASAASAAASGWARSSSWTSWGSTSASRSRSRSTTSRFGEPRWRPSMLAARMVGAGRLGRKTGRG